MFNPKVETTFNNKKTKPYSFCQKILCWYNVTLRLHLTVGVKNYKTVKKVCQMFLHIEINIEIDVWGWICVLKSLFDSCNSNKTSLSETFYLEKLSTKGTK